MKRYNLLILIVFYIVSQRVSAGVFDFQGYVESANTAISPQIQGQVNLRLRNNGQWVVPDSIRTISFYVGPSGSLSALSPEAARRMLSLASTPKRYVQFTNTWCDPQYPNECYAHAGTQLDAGILSAVTPMSVGGLGNTPGSLTNIRFTSMNPGEFGYLRVSFPNGQTATIRLLRSAQVGKLPMTELQMDILTGILTQPWISTSAQGHSLQFTNLFQAGPNQYSMHRNSSVSAIRLP